MLEVTSQLQLLKSDEGMNTLLEGLKSKKRQLKFKEEGIKNLVQETNKLNQNVNDLQLENETLRSVPIHYLLLCVCVCVCLRSHFMKRILCYF